MEKSVGTFRRAEGGWVEYALGVRLNAPRAGFRRDLSRGGGIVGFVIVKSSWTPCGYDVVVDGARSVVDG